MKKALITLLQFILFFVIYLVGSFLPPFHLRETLASSWDQTRVFIWDGLLLMFAAAILILLVEAARKRLRTAAPWTLLALGLATAVGLAAKLGFMTIEH